MMGIVRDLLMCQVEGHGVAQRLSGAEVSGIARVRAASDDDAHPVALAEKISGGPEFNVHMADPVVQRAGWSWDHAQQALDPRGRKCNNRARWSPGA
jgi:hypothetical protein